MTTAVYKMVECNGNSILVGRLYEVTLDEATIRSKDYPDNPGIKLWRKGKCSDLPEFVFTEGGSTLRRVDESKSTNPKDAIGSTKLPLDLVPDSMVMYAAMSFAEGAAKYGSYNWRVSGVRASIYKAALERHLKKWWNGEECDPKTLVPHLASVIACAAIILDANVVGKLNDDRPPKAPLGELIPELEKVVQHLYEMHKDMKPKHMTIKDTDVKFAN